MERQYLYSNGAQSFTNRHTDTTGPCQTSATGITIHSIYNTVQMSHCDFVIHICFNEECH